MNKWIVLCLSRLIWALLLTIKYIVIFVTHVESKDFTVNIMGHGRRVPGGTGLMLFHVHRHESWSSSSLCQTESSASTVAGRCCMPVWQTAQWWPLTSRWNMCIVLSSQKVTTSTVILLSLWIKGSYLEMLCVANIQQQFAQNVMWMLLQLDYKHEVLKLILSAFML